MSSDAMSEESSVCEGGGYDEAFGSGDESEDFSPSSWRETSAESLNGEDEGHAKGSEEVGVKVGKEGSWVDGDDDHDGEDGDGDEDDDKEGSSEGASTDPGDNRPFILPAEWAVNKFLPSMSAKFLRSCASGTKSQSTFQYVSLMKTKNVTRGGQLTSVCMTLCLLSDLGFRWRHCTVS